MLANHVDISALPKINPNLFSDSNHDKPYLNTAIDVTPQAYTVGFRVPVLVTNAVYQFFSLDRNLVKFLESASNVIREVLTYNNGFFKFYTYHKHSLDRQVHELKIELLTINQELLFVVGMPEDFN